jgi:hypothetical protein
VIKIKIFIFIQLGSLLTAVFADDAIVIMAGDPPMKGGMIDGNVSSMTILLY